MTSTQEPAISIVIPTYRRPERMSRLLPLVLSQIAGLSKDTMLELIVVDNCPDLSARDVVTAFDDPVRYFSEPAPGVANARNRGVAEALGEYVLFLDDDELPRNNWLEAFIQFAKQGADACFGPVEPLFEAEPAADLVPALERLFSRRLPARTGQDISHLRAWLGTGNSMFRKSTCLNQPQPFNVDFNDGGEDVWFLRELVQEKGVSLTWCADAIVDEIVPQDRMSREYLKRRIFKNGQLRCKIESGSRDLRGSARVAFWMSVGAVQWLGYGLASGVLRPFSPAKTTEFDLRCAGGLGKLLWWR